MPAILNQTNKSNIRGDKMSDTPENQGLELEEFDAPADENDMAAAMQDDTGLSSEEVGLEAVYNIPVTVRAVLGTKKMQIHQLLKLGRGAMVDLDRKVGEAIDIYINDRLVARGEVVVVDDKLGVTMTEIIKSQD